MAKKSSSNRGRPAPVQAKGAAHKPQAPERTSTATLVRVASDTTPETPSAANIVAETQPATHAVARPAAVAAPAARPTERKTAVAEKPATPKPVAPKPAALKPASAAEKPAAPKPAASVAPAAQKPVSTASREQNQRLARARATQRARQANLISAENYSYVLGDLKLVVALAATAFIVLIALTFVLPH